MQLEHLPIALLTSVMIVAGTIAQAQPNPDSTNAEAQQATKSTEETGDGSQIYFYREKLNFVTSGIHESWIYVDGEKVATLKNNQYVIVPVTAEEHQIALRADSNIRKFKLAAEIGEQERQYYKLVNNPAHAVTVNVIPIADMVTTVATHLEKTDRDSFDALVGELDQVSLIENQENSK